jgi:DNA-directed RNA polymerase II subunit RPB2
VCVAFTESPGELIAEMRDARRRGLVHPHTSISFDIPHLEVHLHTEAGRVTRPLLILDDGAHRFTKETLCRLQSNTLSWTEMLIGYHAHIPVDPDAEPQQMGMYHPSVVEFIDAHEAENTMVHVDFSFSQPGATLRGKTHAEIHPSLILGVVASTICFPDHNQSPRNTYQSAMGKQAMGLYCTNFSKRLDSLGNVLHYPMVPMVQTKVANMIHQDDMPNGANAVVAIMSYSGFNQEDSLLICKNAVDRGFYHSTFYRTYKDDERKNQVSGEEEKFMLPDPTLTRGLKPGSYHAINKHGFARPNTPLRGGDVIIGKTVPIRDGGKHTAQHKPFHDQSTTLRHNESGVVDTSFESCNGDGYRFVKVRVRSIRVPGIGDKFSSCHGQKGTVGMVLTQEDMPFIAKTGIVPDIIINPHCIPSRMTMGQLYETVLSKCGVHLGRRGDGTAFSGLGHESVCDLLEKCGMDRHGNETLVHGQTGEQIPCAVFMGPLYEQRLKHMVDDKIHSRSTGPKVMLTRQPAEGRSRDGGLRIGEMERDCMIGHGAGSFLKESMLDRSDRYEMHVGRKCGLTSVVNKEKNIVDTFAEDRGDSKDAVKVQVPYAFKLLSQELQAMAIAPRLKVL